MPKNFPLRSEGFNPFGELIGLNFSRCEKGYSQCNLEVKEKLLNPHKVLHGAVISAMASTGMGGALYPCLGEEEFCAAIEVKINYFKAVTSGILTCESELIHKGRRIAVLESGIENEGHLIAKAIGTFYIFEVKRD